MSNSGEAGQPATGPGLPGLSAEMVARLDEHAQRRGVTRADVIRYAVERFLLEPPQSVAGLDEHYAKACELAMREVQTLQVALNSVEGLDDGPTVRTQVEITFVGHSQAEVLGHLARWSQLQEERFPDCPSIASMDISESYDVTPPWSVTISIYP
ncbi:CopG family transcriptional regulator [Streptomyces sp. UNOC14_S4]|uniref:ribbon-helix-helix domain-containing protein n=1 Tax=Streptomyces sp. UNOC14_S4 TaxID=2872340 RepID=UPI001E396E2B|nr:CopG family transcriptional regulator [Streptomyces sp. UNOC14_S4]MCC3765992.1 ribbon-helix-helix domain-containing protein [Streptomyces sp. UNOC14_S4]